VTIHPSITFEQWQSVNALVLEGRARKPHPAIGIFGGFVLGAAFALLLITPQTRIAGVLLALGYAFFHNFFKYDLKKRQAASQRRSFADMQPVLNGNQMEIDATGIRGTWVGGKATYDFQWTAFIKLIDRPDDLVFLYAPCCYIRFPKSELAAQEIHQAISWFEASRHPADTN
jgi:hypothetical protein